MINNQIGIVSLLVDYTLLEEQLEYLLTLEKDPDGHIEGLLNMIENMLDHNIFREPK